jgi:hypothetical protein
MRRLLPTVKQAFSLSGRLVVLPNLVDLRTSRPPHQPIDDCWPDYPRLPVPQPTEVELRWPDGSTRTVPRWFSAMHPNYENARSGKPPGIKPSWVYECSLRLTSKEEVPPGTEVCYESDA